MEAIPIIDPKASRLVPTASLYALTVVISGTLIYIGLSPSIGVQCAALKVTSYVKHVLVGH